MNRPPTYRATRAASTRAEGTRTPAEWRRDVERIAADAQRRAAAEFDVDAFIAAGRVHWRAVLCDTPLADVDIKLPVDEPDLVAAATLTMCERAIEVVLSDVDEPLLMAAAVARLVESSLHTFTDPRTGRTHRHLAAAKAAGAFFTPPDIALRMAEAALATRNRAHRCVEPASGTGVLSAALLVKAAELGRQVRHLEAWEISPYLARVCEAVLTAVSERVSAGTEVKVLQSDALVRFEAAGRGAAPAYDIALLNPPYGRIKFLRSSLTNAETRASRPEQAEQNERSRIGRMRTRVQQLAVDLGLGRGTPDYQRMFIAGTHRMLAPGGRLVVIAPSAWTSGKDAADLRAVLIGSRSLVGLTVYPEDCQLFPTVNQPTAVAVIDNTDGIVAFDVSVVDPRTRSPRESYRIAYDELSSIGPNPWRIPLVPVALREAYRQLSAVPRFGDVAGLTNARGELDLTLDAAAVTTETTPVRLVRGDHIERYVLRTAGASTRPGYLSPTGAADLALRPKGRHSERSRVVGRQCSYLGKARRLSFAVVPPGIVAANSLNYVLTDDETDTYALAAALNSAVSEWWFRVHSSNNHVSNYEIDDLPWPLRDAAIRMALRVVGRQLHEAYAPLEFGTSKSATALEDIADALVCRGLNLSPDVARLIVGEVDASRAARVAGMVAWFERSGLPGYLGQPAPWPQHSPPTLSTLDLKMLGYVPQGGNWQAIPEKVPSARLDQIRAMTSKRGVVRTTYYGRLRPDQPAYTISTYYNRPGNGTNIHPHEDRTLTSREAARLQSFPDSYMFLGNDGAVRKQIGNAVPPLVAYAVGKELRTAVDGQVVDLFAGAGGLSLGLELAGCRVAVAVDHDQACEQTYTFNRPCESFGDPGTANSLFVQADLAHEVSRASTLSAIRQKLGGRTLGALVGGPPCQGFSHAGFRDSDDARNDLAVVFLDFVRLLQPQAVVLENVEGLLSYRGGVVIAELRQTLVELGYTVDEPWVLAAETFGVPQMRRRVFLVGTRDKSIQRPPALLERCRGRRERADESHALPYPVTVAEALNGLPALRRVTHPHRGDRPVRTAYQRWTAGVISVPELMANLSG
jgi:Alw26I/Eco31I/Esp3I family type II restriction m6 adenine DNA methyltransferase